MICDVYLSRAARRKRADDAIRSSLDELGRNFSIGKKPLVAAGDLKADAREVVPGPIVANNQGEGGRRVYIGDWHVSVAQDGEKFRC